MKSIIINLILLSICLAASSAADPGIPDTVRIDSVAALPDSNVTVPVYFTNDELLMAVEVVLQYDSAYLIFDSLSLLGTRLEYINPDNVIIFDSSNIINLLAFDYGTPITDGTGKLCDLFFTTANTASEITTKIDTTHRLVQSGGHTAVIKTMFSDTLAQGIYPQFVPGYVSIMNTLPSKDSVWVENIIGKPGETVEINVYGYNEKPLDTVQLAFEYLSNDITFKDAIFTDTRGDFAQTKTFMANNSLGQILVTLVYSTESPLTGGSGPLAKIRFDISSEATPGQTIIIDSISYLDTQPLEFSLTDADGGENFTPIFSPGSMLIDNLADVGDDDRYLLPDKFVLKQNHPNPFNPSTIIEFDMPRSSNVTIKIFNVLGQNVKTLTDGHFSAGSHQVTFNGRNERNEILASGVYFYRLETEGFNQTRKMTLLK